MKRIFIILITGVLLGACQQGRQAQVEQAMELERVSLEKQALQQQMLERDSTLNAFFDALNQISDNLQVIREKEGRISRGAGNGLEGRPDLMRNINEDIRMMGELMEKNRQLIARLNRDSRASNLRISELDRMIERMNQQLEEKEIQIQVMQEELGKMNFRVEYLTATVDTLEGIRRRHQQEIEDKTLELNTAWYALGSRDELRQQGIISREGGFLGLGRTYRLNSNFDQDYFTRVDITNTRQITIPGKKPVLVSPHPEGSWKWHNDQEILLLEILDYKKFWSASRYLVIQME